MDSGRTEPGVPPGARPGTAAIVDFKGSSERDPQYETPSGSAEPKTSAPNEWRRPYQVRSCSNCGSASCDGPVSRDSRGTCRSGIGRPAKSERHGTAMARAHRAERFTRALSVAIPVFAYICR